MTLKLGLPSKGRLQAQAVEWFGARGITVERTGSEREYAGAVRGVDGVDLVLLSAAEIPRELAVGRIHLGVTGQDMVAETPTTWSDGTIWAPDDDKTYRSNMELQGDVLQVEGCVLIICRGQDWTRVE